MASESTAGERTTDRGTSGRANPLDGERRKEVEALAQRFFGRAPERVAFPGGKSRSAFIADMGADGLVVMAKRDDERDAQLEATVLKGLSASGCTPRFVARHGVWLVQECVPGTRLPILLDREPATREMRIGEALDGLLAIRAAAAESGLVHRVPKLGVRSGWFAARIAEMAEAAARLDIAPPALDVPGLSRILDVRHRDFVKWDARPGNALVGDDGRTTWFDWEDCGRHDSMDDLVCLLADEWTPLDAAQEERILDRYLPRFAGRRSADEARRDHAVMTMVQIGFRMRLAVGYWAKRERWWDREHCLNGDKVGVTPQEVGRLIERGRRTADGHALTRPYLPFLDALEERLGLVPALAA